MNNSERGLESFAELDLMLLDSPGTELMGPVYVSFAELADNPEKKGQKKVPEHESYESEDEDEESEVTEKQEGDDHTDDIIEFNVEDPHGQGQWTLYGPDTLTIAACLSGSGEKLPKNKSGECSQIYFYKGVVRKDKKINPHRQKLMDSQMETDAATLDRLRQAQAQYSVRLLGVCRQEGAVTGVLLEQAEGSLRDLLRKRQIDPDAIVDLFFQLVSGLIEMKQNGDLVHGDIKDGNVLYFLNEAGKPYVKLTDFGHADTAGKRQHMFNPLYSPPESLYYRYFTKSHAADIYNVGLLIWQMLGNRLPFHPVDPRLAGTRLPGKPVEAAMKHYASKLFIRHSGKAPYLLHHFFLRGKISSGAKELGVENMRHQITERYLGLNPEQLLYWLLDWVTQSQLENRPTVEQLHEILRNWLDSHVR
ncbi:MAG: protein kinase domain-containing protein [Endozoicomonas sp.]